MCDTLDKKNLRNKMKTENILAIFFLKNRCNVEVYVSLVVCNPEF